MKRTESNGKRHASPQSLNGAVKSICDIKVGKKTPFTLRHFDVFFDLLSKRSDGERSWTVDFSARLQKALEEARPHREQAAELNAKAKALDDQFRQLRKTKGQDEARLAAIKDQWKAVDREAREALAKAETIESAVYDLKAVNPNRVSDEDKRTPGELLGVIADKGREADTALARLRELVSASTAVGAQ